MAAPDTPPSSSSCTDLTTAPEGGPVLLFDGVCNLCQSSVQFVIARDPGGAVRFASLQSEVGRGLLQAHGLAADHLDSLVLIEGGKAWTHSDAALRLTRYLTGPWPLMRIFLATPRFVRDAVYGLIARNRYRLFGREDSCWLPSPDLDARFIR